MAEKAKLTKEGKVDLTGMNFSGATFEKDKKIENADYSRSSFMYVNLSECHFVNCTFDYCDLTFCKLENAKFEDCKIFKSSLRFTNLNGAEMINTTLSDVDLMHAYLNNLTINVNDLYNSKAFIPEFGEIRLTTKELIESFVKINNINAIVNTSIKK